MSTLWEKKKINNTDKCTCEKHIYHCPFCRVEFQSLHPRFHCLVHKNRQAPDQILCPGCGK